MADLLAVVDAGVLRVYSVNGTGAAVELASLRLADTTPSTIVSVMEGLRPFLVAAPPPASTNGQRPPRRRKAATVEVPSARALFDWLVSNGPASQREMREAFPAATVKQVSNRVTTLRASGAVTLDDGRYRVVEGAPGPRREHRKRA